MLPRKCWMLRWHVTAALLHTACGSTWRFLNSIQHYVAARRPTTLELSTLLPAICKQRQQTDIVSFALGLGPSSPSAAAHDSSVRILAVSGSRPHSTTLSCGMHSWCASSWSHTAVDEQAGACSACRRVSPAMNQAHTGKGVCVLRAGGMTGGGAAAAGLLAKACSQLSRRPADPDPRHAARVHSRQGRGHTAAS